MIRLTRRVFTDLSIWMIGLGLIIGVVFPFFVTWMGIPKNYVLKPWFFAACITAGIIVDGLNISLARTVVGSRLRLLGERMHFVTQKFKQIKEGEDINSCSAEDCLIVVDSEDEIGASARSFNTLVETLFQSIETEESLKEFSRILNSKLEVHNLTEQALRQLMAHTQSAAGAIIIEKEGNLEITYSQGIQNINAILESDHVRSAFRSENQIRLILPEDVQVEGVLVNFRPREVLIEPIRYKEIMLGAIVLASPQDYSVDSLIRLGLFSQSLALALHNAMLFDRLERLAALDPLTGIYNRRFGMTRLHEGFGRALRMEIPLGVIMFDLDHFKQINDLYGHLVGDRVLMRLTTISRSVLREGDILVRYGGDEFLAILPGASHKNVVEIAERLRHKVSESSITDEDELIKVTVSLGCVSYPEHDTDNETELVKQADAALYAAKESGRNCVSLAN